MTSPAPSPRRTPDLYTTDGVEATLRALGVAYDPAYDYGVVNAHRIAYWTANGWEPIQPQGPDGIIVRRLRAGTTLPAAPTPVVPTTPAPKPKETR